MGCNGTAYTARSMSANIRLHSMITANNYQAHNAAVLHLQGHQLFTVQTYRRSKITSQALQQHGLPDAEPPASWVYLAAAWSKILIIDSALRTHCLG